MPPLNQRSFYVPAAAFGMAIIVTAYVYTSIQSARRGAHETRQVKYDQILESRKKLGIDAWDQRKERERLRAETEESRRNKGGVDVGVDVKGRSVNGYGAGEGGSGGPAGAGGPLVNGGM